MEQATGQGGGPRGQEAARSAAPGVGLVGRRRVVAPPGQEAATNARRTAGAVARPRIEPGRHVEVGA